MIVIQYYWYVRGVFRLIAGDLHGGRDDFKLQHDIMRYNQLLSPKVRPHRKTMEI